MRRIDAIVIHCTAAPEGSGQTLEGVRDFHVRVRKYKDIGYHFLIEDDGQIRAGRPLWMNGAHARGWNERSVGVAYTGGGFPKDGHGLISGPNEAQSEALKTLVAALKLVFQDIDKVLGHRDTGSIKDCPSFDVAHWLDTGLVRVSRNLA